MQREVRKCTFTKRPISTQDRASVVFTLGQLDENGRYTGQNTIVTASGAIRKDGSVDRLFYADVLSGEL